MIKRAYRTWKAERRIKKILGRADGKEQIEQAFEFSLESSLTYLDSLEMVAKCLIAWKTQDQC